MTPENPDELWWADPPLKQRLLRDPIGVLKERGLSVPTNLPLPIVHEALRIVSLLWVDGRILPLEKFYIDPFDEGLLFGRGVWESTRTVGGIPWLWPAHLERLRHTAALLDIAVAPERLPDSQQVSQYVCGCNWRLDGLAGYRYLNLSDDLSITEALTTGPAAIPVAPGTFLGVQDSFHTRNQFHGGQLGLVGQLRQGPFWAEVTGKVALGDSHEDVNISGFTATVAPGGPINLLPGGLLTQLGNIGSYSRDRFAVVPEAGLRVGCQLTRHLDVTAGYSVLYWTSVHRAGDQIDTAVNSSLIPGPNLITGPIRPLFPDHQTGFWAQGVNLGIRLQF